MMLRGLQQRVQLVLYKFWNPLAFRYGALLGLMYLGCCVQLDYRRPGVSTAWLTWAGTGLSVLSFLLLVNTFYGRRQAGDRVHQTFQWIQRTATVFMAAFIAYSTLLYANGRFDQSVPIEQPAEILTITRTNLPGGIFGPVSLATVRIGERPEDTHTVLLAGAESSKLWPGEPVLIHRRAGTLGLSWVSRIERDEEQYWKKVLAQMPESADPWKRLIMFYFQHHRPKDAALAATRYFEIRTDEYEYACDVAGTLAVHGMTQEARALLEPFVEQRPDYWMYDVLASLFHRLGDHSRALNLFRAAIDLDPENPQAYFELGYLYKEMGRFEEAITMFREVLQYRPIFPEMEEQIRLMQTQVAARSHH